MWVCKYFFYFTIFSVMGWIYETIYVTAKEGKWSNRGFLFGPVVPIYGAGGIGLTAMSDLLTNYTSIILIWWQVFLIAYAGSVVLEYGTSYILEKRFHARWWDYSYMPLNINGRVCVPYSIGFGCAGLLVYYCILPFTRDMTEWVTPILYELFALLSMALIMVDTTLTVSALTDFDKTIRRMDEEANQHMTVLVEGWEEKKEAREAVRAEARQEREERFAEGRDRFAESLQERGEWFAEGRDRLAEEMQRFSPTHMEHELGRMNGAGRSALARVANFSHPKVKKPQIDLALKKIKEEGKKHKCPSHDGNKD